MVISCRLLSWIHHHTWEIKHAPRGKVSQWSKGVVREFARFVGAFGALPKLCFQFRGILLAHVPLKEHLHRKFARFGAERHVTCAAAIRYGERASLRTRAAYVKAAPFLSPPGPPRSLCSRPSVPRDRWPAPRYRRSARKK